MSVEASGRALMAVVKEQDLEGIVATRKRDPYRRGVRWWKIKNRSYSQAVGRSDLFNGARARRPASKRAPQPGLTLAAADG
jgi:ATP-dependent DNA ligase